MSTLAALLILAAITLAGGLWLAVEHRLIAAQQRKAQDAETTETLAWLADLRTETPIHDRLVAETFAHQIDETDRA